MEIAAVDAVNMPTSGDLALDRPNALVMIGPRKLSFAQQALIVPVQLSLIRHRTLPAFR
jgi:hypothetical protein